MKRYQVALVLVVALMPLAVVGYRQVRVVQAPAILGVTYACKAAAAGTFDLHVVVYGAKPDSCFQSLPPKVRYFAGQGEDAATIQVEPLISRSRLAGGCPGGRLYRREGVLTGVPSGSYRLVVLGPRIVSGDVALPRTGHLPEQFVPTPEMEEGT